MNISDINSISPTILTLLILWTLPWKGWALWRAARLQDRAWFIVILLCQTVGILEIIYLFFIRPTSKNHDE